MATPRERVYPAAPQFAGGVRLFTAPPTLYLTGEDRLRVVAVNTLAGVRLKVQWRLATLDGDTVANSSDHVPSTDRLATSRDFEVGVGSLLNVTVFVTDATPISGQTFVTVQLVRGTGAAAVVLATILGGYVTATQPLGYPGSPITSSIEGGGYPRFIVGTVPAAGAEIAETVPTNTRWHLLRLFSVFSTSAAAGNRVVRLKFIAAGAGNSVVTHTTLQAPSQSVWYSWAPGVALAWEATALIATVPLANDTILLAGNSFNSDVFGLQAGDQWSAPQFLVREWLEVSGNVVGFF